MSDEILKGAYSAELYADAIEEMREKGLPRGETIGWQSLDPYYTVPRGQWSVVTGLSGSGKSTFLDNCFVKLAERKLWKFLICSPENQPIKRHIASLMEIYSGKKFGKPTPQYPNHKLDWYMTDAEYMQAFAFVCKHFYFINPPDTEFTVDGIISIASEVHEKHFQFDGMVLDPYNEIEHRRPNGMNETDYVSTVLQKFRNFTRQLDIHFWFVAHPAKPTKIHVKPVSELTEEARKPVYNRINLFDISGSANWKNKCDFGLVVHRDLDNNSPSIIEVQKVRFRENGALGEVPLFYDFLNNRFVEYSSDLLYRR